MPFHPDVLLNLSPTALSFSALYNFGNSVTRTVSIWMANFELVWLRERMLKIIFISRLLQIALKIYIITFTNYLSLKIIHKLWSYPFRRKWKFYLIFLMINGINKPIASEFINKNSADRFSTANRMAYSIFYWVDLRSLWRYIMQASYKTTQLTVKLSNDLTQNICFSAVRLRTRFLRSQLIIIVYFAILTKRQNYFNFFVRVLPYRKTVRIAFTEAFTYCFVSYDIKK